MDGRSGRDRWGTLFYIFPILLLPRTVILVAKASDGDKLQYKEQPLATFWCAKFKFAQILQIGPDISPILRHIT